MSLIYNATFDKNTRKLSFEDKAGNEIYSFIVPERGPAVDNITKPLTFKATQDSSTVKLTRSGSPVGDFLMSTDGGKNWVDYTINDVIRLNIGDEVSFRVKSTRKSVQDTTNYFYFEMTGKIEAWHNVMSLYRTSSFDKYPPPSYAFYSLFYGCTSLIKAPVLYTTRLAQSCYAYMFFRTSLTKAPELPATTLANHCYMSMFSGCESLKEVRISATKTASRALEEWLYNVSATGDFYCNPNATIFPTDSASGIPKGWRRLNINERDPSLDDITKPLTFKATQDGSTVKLRKTGSPSGAFQTSRDGGSTWTDYTIDTAITLNNGDEVAFRAKTNRTSGQDYEAYFYFEMTGKFEAWHNVMSLYRTNDFATHDTTIRIAFYSLFKDCKTLTKAPALPATTLDHSCYESMFFGCQSLTKAPVLPATTLANYCYQYMFSGCQSLTKAPRLPATTLAEFCYESMFYECQSLTRAPELPATTLAFECYSSMFYGCRSLKEVRIAATSSSSSLSRWLSGVSATGDFYCDPNATIFPTDSGSGIPKGWTRHNIADYPN